MEKYNLYGEEFNILESFNNYVVIDYGCSDGKGIQQIYNIFPGISITFHDFESGSAGRSFEKNDKIIEINYCTAGRFECEFKNHLSASLSEGGFAINSWANLPINSNFPLNEYLGVGILIDMNSVVDELKDLLVNFSIDINNIYDKYKLSKRCFICNGDENIKNIFEGFNEKRYSEDVNYYKIKLIELLYYLNNNDVKIQERCAYYTNSNKEKIKRIRDKMINSYDSHMSLVQLVEAEDLSLTLFKRCFKEVYGETPYSYLKKYKMNKASVMLKNRKLNINEIAIELGYKNASKFSKAFQSIMGMTPSEYRKMN